MPNACVITSSSPQGGGSPTGSAPVAAFYTNGNTFYPGDTIQMTDQSTNNPTAWEWYWNGTLFSMDQYPTFYCAIPGQINSTIQLTATNAFGSSNAYANVSVYV